MVSHVLKYEPVQLKNGLIAIKILPRYPEGNAADTEDNNEDDAEDDNHDNERGHVCPVWVRR